MAKKDNIGLLNEIVGQLRQLNRSSVRDQLRENEATKRSEALMGQGEVQEEQQSNIIDAGQDFQRRFLAGQAKTFSDAKLTNTLLGKQKPTTLAVQETSLEHLQALSSDVFLIGELLQKGSLQWGSDFARPIEEPLLALEKVGDEQLAKFDDLLIYFNDRDKWDKMQAAEQARIAEENRREAIQNTGGKGAGTGVAISGGGIDDEEEDSLLDPAKTAFMTIAGTWLAAKLAKMTKWFKGLKGVLGKLGTALFVSKSKMKLTGPQKKMARNPRLWPLLLGALLVSSFMKSTDEVEKEWDAESGADTQDSARGGHDSMFNSVWGGTGTVLNAVLWTTMLTPLLLKTRIGKATDFALRRALSAAPKNSVRGQMWKKMAKYAAKRGLQAGAASFLRFLGPWGFAAWAVWTIVDWQLEKMDHANAAAEASFADILAIDNEEGFKAFTETDEFNQFKFKEGTSIPRDFSRTGEARRDAEIQEKVKALLRGKNEQEIEWTKRWLIENGDWSEGRLNTLLSELDTEQSLANIDALQRGIGGSRHFTTGSGKFIEYHRWKQKPIKVKQNKKQWMIENNPGYEAWLQAQELDEAARQGILTSEDAPAEMRGSTYNNHEGDKTSYNDNKIINIYTDQGIDNIGPMSALERARI